MLQVKGGCSLDAYAGRDAGRFCRAVQKQGMEAATERHDTKAHSCRNRRSAANLSKRRSRVASDWSPMEEETNGSLKVSTPSARFELDCQEHGDSNKHLDCTCTCCIVVAHLICNNLISTFFFIFLHI